MRWMWGAAAAAMGMCALFAATESSAQNGSFRGSCRNVSSLGGGFVSAECADGSGRWRSSTINSSACIGDIGNQNGMLACNGAVASGGAYVVNKDSARDRDRDRDRNSGYGGDRDYARDRDRDGDRDRYDDRGRRSSRNLSVSGSYQESCRDYGVLEGGYLTAECASSGGRFRESTLQYTRCRSDISNQGGLLACDGAVATGGRYLNDDRE